MPGRILQQIKEGKRRELIIAAFKADKQVISLFIPAIELNGNTPFNHILEHGTLYDWHLIDLINERLFDFQEISPEGLKLIDALSYLQDIEPYNQLIEFKALLAAGNVPSLDLYTRTEHTPIGSLLRYKPGRNNPSIFELATMARPRLEQLKRALLDYDETTEEESSDEEFENLEGFTPADKEIYDVRKTAAIAAYNADNTQSDPIRLIAARGVHFVPQYFPKATREAVFESREESHTTYSFSTLFDAGYAAVDQPEEDDARIVPIHQRNLQFVADLKNTPDRAEIRIGNLMPARTDQRFENLYYHEIQAYINSFKTMFSLQGIRLNFGFASNNNPHLSLSWKTEVAGMYGSGKRFGWSEVRRDPHYRRFDGKPKHPKVGYIDIFEFPVEYVRANSTDRLLIFNADKIKLSNLFRSEAEVIFHSMISKDYHLRRYMIVLPSFNTPQMRANVDDKYYGMTSKGTYTKARNEFHKITDGELKSKNYHSWVDLRIEKAVAAQSSRINQVIDLGLFRRGKVRGYDHGNSVQLDLPQPK